MSNKSPNIQGMIKHSKEKRIIAEKRVDEAIKRMVKNKNAINFNSISLEADVSKTFLYKHIDIRKRIEKLRQQQEGFQSPRSIKLEMTDNSKDVLIESLKRRVKKLEEENHSLKEKVKLKYGEIYNKL